MTAAVWRSKWMDWVPSRSTTGADEPEARAAQDSKRTAKTDKAVRNGGSVSFGSVSAGGVDRAMEQPAPDKPAPPEDSLCFVRAIAGNLANHIANTWKPGERIAYREGGALVTAKYAGVSIRDAVNVWLADGATRAIPAAAVALDWRPPEADVFEERLSVMLNAGVPEDVARNRAAVCTREYLARFHGSK